MARIPPEFDWPGYRHRAEPEWPDYGDPRPPPGRRFMSMGDADIEAKRKVLDYILAEQSARRGRLGPERYTTPERDAMKQYKGWGSPQLPRRDVPHQNTLRPQAPQGQPQLGYAGAKPGAPYLSWDEVFKPPPQPPDVRDLLDVDVGPSLHEQVATERGDSAGERRRRWLQAMDERTKAAFAARPGPLDPGGFSSGLRVIDEAEKKGFIHGWVRGESQGDDVRLEKRRSDISRTMTGVTQENYEASTWVDDEVSYYLQQFPLNERAGQARKLAEKLEEWRREEMEKRKKEIDRDEGKLSDKDLEEMGR